MPPSSRLPAASEPIATEGPLAQYRAWRARGELLHDPAQELAAEKLQGLARALAAYQPGHGESGWRVRLGLAEAPEPPPMGLYIFGKVGRGKSMLMDMFFACATVARKRRVHFYEFMQDVHRRIHARRAEKGDPIGAVAHAIAAEATLLCFDEFQVTDIADAMILGRLFARALRRGRGGGRDLEPPARRALQGRAAARTLPALHRICCSRSSTCSSSRARATIGLQRFVGRQVYFTPADDKRLSRA